MTSSFISLQQARGTQYQRARADSHNPLRSLSLLRQESKHLLIL